MSYSAGCMGSLTYGEPATCTVTNNDIAPTLTVVKHVVNKGGSSAQASDFTIHVTGNPITPGAFAGAESPRVERTLAAGPYEVSETGSATADYTETRSADCAGTLTIGDAKTCTITNTRRANVTIRTVTLPEDPGKTTPFGFASSLPETAGPIGMRSPTARSSARPS